MARPVLIINGHDYAPYIEELSPSRNDLDADGSGRDVQTGEMFRTRIAVKQKWEVATVLDPVTGGQTVKTFYTSSVPFGAQRYDKSSGATFYDGMTFSMTEK